MYVITCVANFFYNAFTLEENKFKSGYISKRNQNTYIIAGKDYCNHLSDAKIFKTHEEATEFYQKLLKTDFMHHGIKKLSYKELYEIDPLIFC
jgi:hypothetical protein